MKTYDNFIINEVLSALVKVRGTCILSYNGKRREVQVLEHTLENNGDDVETGITLCYQYADACRKIPGGFRKFRNNRIRFVDVNITSAKVEWRRMMGALVTCAGQLDDLAERARMENTPLET